MWNLTFFAVTARSETTKQSLLSDYFYQNPFTSFAIKLAVENLFPWSKIKTAMSYSYYHFPSHQRTFDMSICIVFKTVVFILRVWLLGCKFFEPDLKIVMQTRFII